MSSGSDPHLMALLRAIRLRLAAPEAAAMGAADTDAALSGDAGAGQSLTRTSTAPGTPRRPELPPPEVSRLGLPPAPQPLGLPPGRSAAPPGRPPHGGAEPPVELPAAGAQTPVDLSPAGAQPTSAPGPGSLNPVAGLSAVGRPVPGQWPEPAPEKTLPGVPPTPGPHGVPPTPGAHGVPPTPGAHGVPPTPGAHGVPPTPGAHGLLPTPGAHGVPPTPGAHGLLPTPGAHVVPPTPGAHGVPPTPGAYAVPPPPGVHGVTPTTASSTPPAVDGMHPADDAALRAVQRLLGSSLSLAGGVDEVATRLRAALVLAQPEAMAMLPGGPLAQRAQLGQALTWLVHHLDQPPALVAGCVQLGAALAECGIQPQQLQLVGAALAEAMRAGIGTNGWRQDFDEAWRATWQHVHEWIGHGAAGVRYQPATWLAEVVSHERRRPDLAVVRFRPFLPMPYRPGQYARIELPELPGVWRPYSLAGAPRRDTIVELHVRAKTEAGVSGALVYRIAPDDLVRFSRAEGSMGVPEQPGRDLLLVAGDTGVVPLKAMLTELAATGDRRSAVLFWGVRTLDELYDIEEIAMIARACHRATVVPVVSEGEAGPYASGLVTDAIAAYGEWSEHEVYLAGPPVMIAATSAALRRLGVSPDRIHHDAPEG